MGNRMFAISKCIAIFLGAVAHILDEQNIQINNAISFSDDWLYNFQMARN